MVRGFAGSRRHATRAASLVVLVMALALGLAAGRSSAGPAQVRPNVLILLTDDQRLRGTLGVMDKTMRIFRDGGVRYSNAYTTTPQCCPSRASIFSGQYVHNHGVLANGAGDRFDAGKTWQRELDDVGYRTALFGKYMHGFPAAQDPPHFDRAHIGFAPGHDGSSPTQDRFVAGKARRFIRAAEDSDPEPWAMMVAFKSPHEPLNVPRRLEHVPVGRFRTNPAVEESNFADKNPELEGARRGGKRAARRSRRAQLRMLISVDAQVGRLFETMRETGEGAQTLAIFTSDNGYFWGEHGLQEKFLPYLDALRVPMLLRWPGQLAPGDADSRLAANIDLAPTIYEAARITPDYPVDGRSLLSPSTRDWLLVEGPRSGAHPKFPIWRRGYLDADEHYFQWADGFREFYDLARDPWELHSRPDDPRVRGLRQQVAAASDCAGADCP